MQCQIYYFISLHSRVPSKYLGLTNLVNVSFKKQVKVHSADKMSKIAKTVNYRYMYI